MVEEEPAPYPDIPEELPGMETVENQENVTPALITEQDDGKRVALDASRNANTVPGEDMLEQGLVIVESDEESLDGDGKLQVVDNVDMFPDDTSVEERSQDKKDHVA